MLSKSTVSVTQQMFIDGLHCILSDQETKIVPTDQVVSWGGFKKYVLRPVFRDAGHTGKGR